VLTRHRPGQAWRQIAEEASHETDPYKLVALVRQLIEALEDERNKQSPFPIGDEVTEAEFR
jgi:hypothetical protein